MDNPLLIPVVGSTLLLGLKIGVIVILFIYLLFALIVVKQVATMNAVLKTKLAPFLSIMGYAHFLFALLIFALSFVML